MHESQNPRSQFGISQFVTFPPLLQNVQIWTFILNNADRTAAQTRFTASPALSMAVLPVLSVVSAGDVDVVCVWVDWYKPIKYKK
jgi:hypothetical protein